MSAEPIANAAMRPFTFCYRKYATAAIRPVETVECEGVVFSNGTVALEEDKNVYRYDSLDKLYEDYARHGKGTIRFTAGVQEQEEHKTP